MFMHTRCHVDYVLRNAAVRLCYDVGIVGRAFLRFMNRDPLRVWQDDGE